ncbi:VOC family protein [Streptomyces venezuelae]|nr:bleomycin resistance protein [Streptomyces venezuelae]QES02979.1 VOC family protein [Streptomyces venezuelae ATCC 10712]QES10001.1 VOC family protein [Streptomyces venezuelae]QES11345.1 VOC family protein [Streptomyces venezuelae]
MVPVSGPTTGEAVGAPCWLNLTAHDLDAAERFYGAVLGWTFQRGGEEREYSVGRLGEVPVAGIAAVAAELSVGVAWTAFFAVDDADETVARIRERGGTVGVGPVAYPPHGRAALATDREGALFGVWEGRTQTRWHVGEHTAPAWLELHTRDAFEAAVFYGEVLRWADGGPGSFEVSYEQDKVVLRREGEAVARLNSGPVEAASAQPQLRPRWLVRFRVPDPEAAAAAVVEHGGLIVPGGDWGGVRGPEVAGERRAVAVRDPEGALFTLEAAEDGKD